MILNSPGNVEIIEYVRVEKTGSPDTEPEGSAGPELPDEQQAAKNQVDHHLPEVPYVPDCPIIPVLVPDSDFVPTGQLSSAPDDVG